MEPADDAADGRALPSPEHRVVDQKQHEEPPTLCPQEPERDHHQEKVEGYGAEPRQERGARQERWVRR